MSEFTEGTLFRRSDTPIIENTVKRLTIPQRLETLNDEWGVLLADVRLNSANRTELGGWARESSSSLPLLGFQHAGDHGWGYQLFHEGKICASCEVSHEIEFGMVVEQIEALHPDLDPMDVYVSNEALTQRLYAEICQSAAYRANIEAQYQHKNVAAFASFGTPPNVIRRLDALLTAESYLKAPLEQVFQFREALNLLPMEWKNYHYDDKEGE
ncbi:MAG: hypothetical protein SGI73_04570 [Chloroflexota bacterium]|nr:hypothetical protein [Chloroflexota bacterium]